MTGNNAVRDDHYRRLELIGIFSVHNSSVTQKLLHRIYPELAVDIAVMVAEGAFLDVVFLHNLFGSLSGQIEEENFLFGPC